MAKAFYAKGKVLLVEPLGSAIRMGSVGYFDQGQWVELGTTSSFFKLKLSETAGAGEPNSFDGKGGKGLKFEAYAKGETSALSPDVAKAQARAEINFGSEDSFVMNVKNQTVKTASELGELIAAIRYAYRYRAQLPASERWEKHYAVVVGVASAESVTALSASTKNATAVVSGSASVSAPTSPADLDASMKVSFTKESVDKLWRGPANGYAVQALKIKPSIFKRWDREDVVFAKTKGLVAAPSGLPARRPKAYSEWLASSKLKPVAASGAWITHEDAIAKAAPVKRAIARNAKKKAGKRA
jgi:hypothetical protein